MDSAALKYTQLTDDADESHQNVLALIPQGANVLEVGASVGYMSKAIEARGSRVVAVEPDPEAAAIAKKAGVDVRIGRLEDVVLGEEFDCVVLADVLEHVTDPDGFMTTVLRHLVPKGCIVLSVPNVAHWSLRWSLLWGRFNYTRTGLLDETHVRLYTAATLDQLLRRHGLTVTDRRASIGAGYYPRWRLEQLLWRQRQLCRVAVRRLPGLFAYQFVWRVVRLDTVEPDLSVR